MSTGIDDPHAVLIMRMSRERARGGRGHRVDSRQGVALKADLLNQFHDDPITCNLYNSAHSITSYTHSVDLVTLLPWLTVSGLPGEYNNGNRTLTA